MKMLREYIQSVLRDQQVLIPPPPSTEFRKSELSKISNQRKNSVTPSSLSTALDSGTLDLFNKILVSAGLGCHKEAIKKIRASIEPFILFHKRHFNTSRPHQLAAIFDVDFDFDDLESARTPSYPSGHTAQAFFTAHKLSEMYPFLREDLYALADMVAQSRIDAGVHFPSDNIAGKMLADKLSRMI